MSQPSIFVIGDSISVQYGPYLKKYVKGVINYNRKEAIENSDVPESANGGDSSQVKDFLLSLDIHKQFTYVDYLLINCGLHDIKTDPKSGEKQVALNNYRENLREIINISKDYCGQLVWIRTTPCFEEIHNQRTKKFYRFYQDCKDYNQAADEIMQENDIKMIDLYTFTLNQGDDIYCDHVHFKKDIRKRQASFIAGWLFNELI